MPAASAPAQPAAQLRTDGNALFGKGDWRAASKAYEAALALLDGGDDGDDAAEDSGADLQRVSCYLNRAACFLQMERFGSAAQDCTAALELDKCSVKAWYRRAQARSNMHQADGARDDLRAALRLAPEDRAVQKLFAAVSRQATDPAATSYFHSSFDYNSGRFVRPDASTPEQLLFRAASDGDHAAVAALVAQGADAAARHNGFTPLMSAARRNHVACVQALLPLAGAAACADDGRAPVHLAAERGHEAAIRAIAAHDAALVGQLTDDGSSALHFAAFGGHVAAIEALLELGGEAIASRANTEGICACHRAAEAGHVAALERLARQPFGIAATTGAGQTVMHKAAEHNRVQVLRFLLDEGSVHPMTPDGDGFDAIKRAANRGSLDSVKLLANSTSVEMLFPAYALATTLHISAGAGQLEVCRFLLSRKVFDLHAQERRGWTALHCAAAAGHVPVCQLLVAAEPSLLDDCDGEGRTAEAMAFDSNSELAGKALKYLTETRPKISELEED